METRLRLQNTSTTMQADKKKCSNLKTRGKYRGCGEDSKRNAERFGGKEALTILRRLNTKPQKNKRKRELELLKGGCSKITGNQNRDPPKKKKPPLIFEKLRSNRKKRRSGREAPGKSNILNVMWRGIGGVSFRVSS